MIQLNTTVPKQVLFKYKLIEMKTIEDVQEYLCGIPNLNSGGCGLAAYAMYLWFEKNDCLPEDFEIVYMHRAWGREDFDTNRAFLEGNKNSITSCSHAVVFFNGKYQDCNGENDTVGEYSYKLSIGREKIDEFMKASLKASDWNPYFKRDVFLPEMEETLGIEFNLNK